ncbi:uncharacterized protein LOC133307336 [Gastrolobium bilobum]|uniref:uncharacterized protein LOC133307336 n=1 Tax=Gastrolobium bilobum TaxID=150636 RepID=UPI002AB2CD23|nr:uncharacterized protein LOC133307336 [Gastrolobium bilobum]XP_061363816.1 uncharacterized protein LOC133307336 [Gastrolobium bilobum]XP_061363817.1 uncharacterized protein LOC133307336 [Gastrolobium bilobum]XP_061363818.1 uncharacterized protein LOC133307336 [Gastrolobium bilobum]
MNGGMASLTQTQYKIHTSTFWRAHPRSHGLLKSGKLLQLQGLTFPSIHINQSCICCTKLTPWEPSPVTYAPTDNQSSSFLQNSANIFETLDPSKTADSSTANAEELLEKKYQQGLQLQFFKWPMWLLGPSILLATGMVPTLWLPMSSIFLGPNIASLLSLVGLDCIFNLGATLFLLMADSCSQPKYPTQDCNSKAPFSYQFWNIVATLTGFIVPLLMMFGSEKGFLQPQLPLISFAVLLGPYFLLLSVQILTEILTWHWQSPVWLVTPVIYESYRVLQLMRGLKLGVELNAPAWMMHTVRGLVCWWVLILGLQLMRVAWFAGLTAQARNQQLSHSDASAANGITD